MKRWCLCRFDLFLHLTSKESRASSQHLPRRAYITWALVSYPLILVHLQSSWQRWQAQGRQVKLRKLDKADLKLPVVQLSHQRHQTPTPLSLQTVTPTPRVIFHCSSNSGPCAAVPPGSSLSATQTRHWQSSFIILELSGLSLADVLTMRR